MKRGQAALEFLSTYGWAILMILVAISALAYLGVFNFKNLAPERCMLGSDFDCDAILSKAGELQIVMSYKLDQSVTISNFTITCLDCQDQPTYECTNEANEDTFVLKRLTKETITCDLGSHPKISDAGEKVKLVANFKYQPIGKAFPKNGEGELLLMPQ